MDRKIPLKEQRKETRKKILYYGAGFALLLTGIFIAFSFLQNGISSKNIILGKVDRGTIEVTLNASGKVIPLTEEIIVSPIGSRILEVYKETGDSVAAGEPILKLDLSTIETDYRKKLDEKEMKNSKLIQTKISLENSISDLEMQIKVKDMKIKQMETELKNEIYLDSLGATTADRLRQASLNFEVTKLELQQLKQQVENQKKNAEAELKVQQLDLSMFEKSLGENVKLLNDARILSPRKGILTYVNNQIGSQASAGTQIAIVSDLSNYKIEAEIPDSYAERLSPGAKATVKIGQLQLEGTVVNITPSVNNGVIKFIVMLKDPGNSRLRGGLRTDVYVTHGVQDNTLRLPNASFYTGAAEYDLWIVKDEKAEKRKVTLGESSFEYIEVINGLEEGESIIISDMSAYRNKKTLKIK